MSSRALRKAQQEQERLKLEKEANEDLPDNEQEEAEEDEGPMRVARPSAYALLNEDDDDNEPEDEVEESFTSTIQTTEDEDAQDSTTNDIDTRQTNPKRKKKKKKSKAKTTEISAMNEADDMDEIDKALKSLSMTTGSSEASTGVLPNVADPTTLEVCKLLSIDTHHLNVANEMRRLFGRAAFTVDREEEAAAVPQRQRFSETEGMSLAEAVKGKHAAGGAGLPAVLRRRNVLFPGKEDWPRATGGGLNMEIVEKRPGGIVEYRFVHNESYQQTQHQFEMCVLSMNPTTMVHLLRDYPYHVSTLLQVSEVAKHEKDYATSGDLLERAIFSFGRAAHSTFGANLAQGKARLDFRRPENREFWLACWRYIGNISMRATWRTAYEWARLLLSLDPENDPYCVSLVIDQLALRAKQAGTFLQLCQTDFFKSRWANLPNVQFSQCLAARETTTQSAQGMLANSISEFPWVAARLLQELDTDKLPKSVWGKTPRTPSRALYTELYATTAKDLWKATGAAQLLLAAAESVPAANDDPPFTEASQVITRSLARFTVLTDKPSLISLLPRELTALFDNASDPLPPENSISSYSIDVDSMTNGMSTRHQHRLTTLSLSPRGADTITEDLATRVPAIELMRERPREFIQELSTFQRFLEFLMPGLAPERGGAAEGDPENAELGTNAGSDDAYRNASTPSHSIPGAWVSEDTESPTAPTPSSQSSSPTLPQRITPNVANLTYTDTMVTHVVSRTNLSAPEVRACLTRLISLRNALVTQPGRRVRDAASRDEAVMGEDGAMTFYVAGVEAEHPGAVGPPSDHDDDGDGAEDQGPGLVEGWGASGEPGEQEERLYRTIARGGAGLGRSSERPEVLDDEELARALFEEELEEDAMAGDSGGE